MIRVHVAYLITREDYAPGTSTVVLTPEQTTEADIPNMIAIKRGVTADEVVIIATEQI